MCVLVSDTLRVLCALHAYESPPFSAKSCVHARICFRLHFQVSICSEHKSLFVPILPVCVCVCVCVCVFLHPCRCRAKGPSGSYEGRCFTVPQPDSWALDSLSCYPTSTVLHHIPLQITVRIPPSSHRSPTDRQALQRRYILWVGRIPPKKCWPSRTSASVHLH